MEAPDQDYVFQRSFPDFNPSMYGLYKVKTLSFLCGDDEMNSRLPMMGVDVDVTPPYSFERGEHRPKMPVVGNYGIEECDVNFRNELVGQFGAAYAANLQADDGDNCGKFLVDSDLIGRKLGVKAVDKAMEDFINHNLAGNKCDDKCSNSNLADEVDVTNYLRNIAVMAALLHSDSPLGNGNNYYLVNTGAETKLSWAMIQYDHNNMLSSMSASLCTSPLCLVENLMKWSITRPTCNSLEEVQMVGPLLSDDVLHARYIDYIQEFVDNVMTNDAFLDQIHDHIEALQDDIIKDPYSYQVQDFSLELSQGDQWLHMFDSKPYIPFLPAIRARSAEIKKQLQALGDGSFPRELDDILPDEFCVNWEAEGPVCPGMCKYEGCDGPEFLSTSCDPKSGFCSHGLNDLMCAGVAELGSYEGMENFEGSDRPAYCSTGMFGPQKWEQCPEKPVEEDIVKDLEESETNEYVTKDPKESVKDGDPNKGSVETEMDDDKSSGSNITHNLYGFAVAVLSLAVVISL